MGTLDVVILGAFDRNPWDLEDELCKAKSALLYGDHVLVRSHKVNFLTGAAATTTRLLTKRVREEGIDQEAIKRITTAIEASERVRGENKDFILKTLRGDHPEVFFEFPEIVAELLRSHGPLDGELFFRRIAATAIENLAKVNGSEEGQRAIRTAEELIRLNESGIVRIDTGSTPGILSSELEDVEDAFRRSLEEAVEAFSAGLEDHHLLSTETGLQIRDAASPPVRKKANRAELAASMLADIPSFPTASVDEILDIRQRVTPQLSRFRAAVAELEEELNANVGDDNFPAEVEDLKLRRVAPELEELNESLRQEGLSETVSRSAPYLASGVLGLGASVAIGAPTLAGAIAVSAGATTAVAKEIVERAKFGRERHRHRLFLLFDVARRLSRR